MRNQYFKHNYITVEAMININEMALNAGKGIQLSQSELNWTKEHGFISFITDCEGDLDKYIFQKKRNESLIQGLKEANSALQSVNTTVIYGGDATDKGTGNIRILFDLKKTRLSGTNFFISGNRDVNKIRLIEALSPKLQATFSTINSDYDYWGKNTSPKAWVDAHNKEGDNSPLYKKFKVKNWSELKPTQQHLAILSFIFEKTMAAPNYLADLEAESIEVKLLTQNPKDEDLLNMIYALHFSKELCATFIQKNWLPTLTDQLSSVFQGLQSDYVEHATLGMVIGGVIFEHSLTQAFPRKQDGSEIGLLIRHRAKIELIGSMALMLVSIAAMSQLLAFSAVAAIAIVTIGSVVALFLAYNAYKTSQKSIVSRWFDVRNAELAQQRKSYLDIATQNPDDLFDWSSDCKSLLNPHPYVSAGLQQSNARNDVIISTNSTKMPMTENHAKLLQANGAKAFVYGHQPCALPMLHKLPGGFWTAGCDVIGDAIGGGVVAGANLFSTEHLTKVSDQSSHTHVVSSQSEEMYGTRTPLQVDNTTEDYSINITSNLNMIVNLKPGFFKVERIVDKGGEAYSITSRKSLSCN